MSIYNQPAPTTTRPLSVKNAWARYANMILGVWLFISAWVWPHSPAMRADTWIVGVLMVLFALWARWSKEVHWANTALAVWLFFSTLAIHHVEPGTRWNNIIVAIVAFAVSLVPARGGYSGPRRTAHA